MTQKTTRKIHRSSSQHKQLQAQPSNELGINFTLILGMVFLLALAGIYFAKGLPIWVLGWYCAINLATFLLYAHDKHSAQHNTWRVQESTLHKLALLGGWIGAGLAQKLLRHKSQKREFRKIYYLTIFGNWLFLAVLWYFNYR